MKKKTENDLKVLLVAAGFLAALASHFLVHDPLTLEMEGLQVEIDAQTAEKMRLKEIELQKDVLLLETEENRIIVENELQKYPEDVLPETYFMYADNLRNDLEVTIDGVNISNPTLMNKLTIMRWIEEQNVEVPVASYLTTLSFGWQFSYDQLKSFIEYVHSDQYRTVVNTVNVSYNAATGHLTGNTVIYKYFITTPSYVYEPADIPLVDKGNDNPFGTLASGQAPPQA